MNINQFYNTGSDISQASSFATKCMYTWEYHTQITMHLPRAGGHILATGLSGLVKILLWEFIVQCVPELSS
jgi:hypothetical protein